MLPSDDALLANTALAATVLADAALRATVLPDAALAAGALAATLLAENSRHGSRRPEDCRPHPPVREYRRRFNSLRTARRTRAVYERYSARAMFEFY